MNPSIECLGWTLVHFVWQGVVVALLLAIVLRLLRRAPANQRYFAGCVALAFMVLAPLITSYWVAKRAEPVPMISGESAPIVTTPTDLTAQATTKATKGTKVVAAARPVPVREELTRRLNSVLPWLVMGWFVGVFALSCRLLAGWLRIRYWQRDAAESLVEPWREKLDELARRLSISHPVRLVQSALVEVPTVIGWLRPVILLPGSCVTGLSPQQLESILAHELAHIHRHDYLINLLQSAVETLLFYHPAVWWVSRRIREERENCCDDIAVRICGDPVVYARALATLEELRSAPAQLAMAADGGGSLLQRIQRLLGKSGGPASPVAWPLAATIMIIALMAVAIGLRETRAMASEPPKPETFITHFGIYHFTNNGAATELTVETNRVFMSSSKGTSLTTAGEGYWRPGHHWFAYIDKDWHVWAYDGAQGLWVVAADSLSSKMRSLEYLDEIPPDAVLKRLPMYLKKTALEIAKPNDEKRREFEKLIREGEAHNKERRRSQMNEDRQFASLELRTLHTDAQSLFRGLEKAGFYKPGGETSATADMKKLQTALRDYFASNGIEFPTNALPGDKTFVFDDRAGVLLVRATHAELDIIVTGVQQILSGNAARASVPAADVWPADSGQQTNGWFYYRITNSGAATAASPVASTNRSTAVETRTFHVDPEKFLRGLEDTGFYSPPEQTNSAGRQYVSGFSVERLESTAIRQFLKAHGVDILTNASEGKALAFNDRTGQLQVRATGKDVDMIQSALVGLLQEKPEINIKVKFVEISESAGNSTGLDWVLKDSWARFTNNPTPLPKVVSPYKMKDSNSTATVNLTVTNSIISQQMTILNERPYSMVIHKLETESEADVLTTPEVTTLDSRQAQIQMLDIQTVVVGMDPASTGKKSNSGPLTENLGFGPIFDVLPKVTDDGLSIKMKMTASVTGFKGYATANPPTPLFDGRRLEAEATVPDAQTVILAGEGPLTTVVMKSKVPVLGSIPLLGRLFQSKSVSKVRKNLLVFVTPTLINPDGSRYHSDGDSNGETPSTTPAASRDEAKKTN